jgi:hypothetical protein
VKHPKQREKRRSRVNEDEHPDEGDCQQDPNGVCSQKLSKVRFEQSTVDRSHGDSVTVQPTVEKR